MLLVLAFACNPGPAPTPAPAVATAGCPPGMVRVEGTGVLGMRGQPYGVVETAHLARVEAPERGCAAAVAGTRGAVTCWVQTDLTDPVLDPRPVEIDPFCIDAFPFPGEGAHYTRDGMTAWDAARLDELLSSGRYGPRRLCTFTEFEAAVAGLRANRRFVFGDGAPADGACPEEGPIGADPGCANPETGVHDYAAVMGHWVLADGPFLATGCGRSCRGAGGNAIAVGDYLVAGGTRRAQTRQAPLTPHTWHDHGEPNPAGCDDMGHDDQPVICATPDARYAAPLPAELAAQEAAWAELVALARATGSMTRTLEAGLGREICPRQAPED